MGEPHRPYTVGSVEILMEFSDLSGYRNDLLKLFPQKRGVVGGYTPTTPLFWGAFLSYFYKSDPPIFMAFLVPHL